MPPTSATSSHIPFRIIVAVSTALGFFSAFAAFYFVSTFTDKPASFGLLLTLNLGYWYSWAALTPAMCTGIALLQLARSKGKRRVSHRIAGVSAAHEYQ